jgi:hypothetical protein
MHRYFSPIKFRYGSNLISQRTTNGFNKAAGMFSDLIVTSFLKKKMGGCQTQKEKQIEPQGNRNPVCT